MNSLFASTARGLEELLKTELESLGAQECQVVQGGVHFEGDTRLIYQSLMWSRLASRIMLPMKECKVYSDLDLYTGVQMIDWTEIFTPNATFAVHFNGVNDEIRNSQYGALRVKDAIVDCFTRKNKERPNVDRENPDLRINVWLNGDTASISLDLSGAGLHLRGYRDRTGMAPIKETLAAAIVMRSGWQPGTPLLDPMCGSGTFLVEAAQIALNIAPGAGGRSFGFQRLKNFRLDIWKDLLDAAQDAEKPAQLAQIYGSDISPVAVRAALANLDRAGLLPAVTLRSGDVLEIDAPAPAGIMIANPPYGERLSEQEELAAFYPQLGSALKRKFAGWNCYLLTADLRLPKLMRLTPSKKTPLYNGAIECRLFEFKMVSGSNRPK